MAHQSLYGKGAIVTGAGSGINLAFAKQLYESGCHVLIMDIQLHHTGKQWLDGLPKNNSTKVFFYQADVANWKELDAVFDVYDREIGGTPYVVCPGAGIYEPSVNSFWSDQDKDGHYHLFDVNLLAPLKMMRIAVRKMLQADQPGIILHVSSIGCQKPSIVTPLYQCSKNGISSMVRSIGPSLQEMTGIRVVAVAPGITLSPLFTDHPKAMRFLDMSKDFTVSPDQIADGMMALVRGTKYPPGTVLEVTGGPEHWREVQIMNDPGPQGPGTVSSNKEEAIDEIQKIFEADRTSRRSGSARL